MYTQGPLTAIHLREDLLVELSLMQYYGIVTNLPFSNYLSPLFAQRKQSGALRFLIDMRRLNLLIRHDYDSHNFPISTLADASAHLAEKTLFAKLDCSHAYFALRMADPLSVQLLSFNFFSRFLLSRVWLCLSRSVSAFSSFTRKFLDACFAEDKCFQYVDDLVTAAHTFDKLLTNLKRYFRVHSRVMTETNDSQMWFSFIRHSILGKFNYDRRNVRKPWESWKIFEKSQNAENTEANVPLHRIFPVFPGVFTKTQWTIASVLLSFTEQPRKKVHTRTSRCNRNSQKGLSEGMWFCSSLTKTRRSVCYHGWCQLLCCRLCPNDKLY